MNPKNFARIGAVLLAFFVMSFVDMVGVATDYVKADFDLPDGLVQFISSAAFLWFFVFSVPTGLLQARMGKRNVLCLGVLLSAVGLILPFVSYSFASVLVGFSLLGIGNTIIQVSANPLLVSVVGKERAPSFMSLSQFTKSIGSMIAAPLSALLLAKTGNWKLLFVIFAAVSVLSAICLYSVSLKEKEKEEADASFGSCFKLLSDKYVALMVLGIFLIVGIDVGVNAASGQFLMEKFGMEQGVASSGRSLYFMGKLIGCLLGAILLTKFKPNKFLNITNILLAVAVLAFALNPFSKAVWPLLILIGFFAANIFPLIFTLAVGNLPEKANEISGLMMMAISGGAVIPPVLGAIADTSNYTMSLLFLMVCAIVILLIGMMNKPKKAV